MSLDEASRRQLLAVLGVTGTGALAGCSVEDLKDGAADLLGTSDDGAGTVQNHLAEELSQLDDEELTAVRSSSIAFVRSDVRFSSDDDAAMIGRMEASPERSTSGDRLLLEPNRLTAAQFREFLLSGWGVPKDAESVRATIDGATIQLEGGEGPDIAALAGTARDPTERVYVARADTVDDARTIARNW